MTVAWIHRENGNKKIAVLGAGNVRGTLAAALASAGHEVILGVRDPESSKYKELAKRIGHDTRVDSIRNAADSAEAILLATPWSATQPVLEQVAGCSSLSHWRGFGSPTNTGSDVISRSASTAR